MDIRGKVSQIDAKKKFHLIEDHINLLPDDPQKQDPRVPQKVDLFKLFFGLELGCGRRGKCGGNASSASTIASDYYGSIDEEFKEFVDDEKMMDQD